MGAQKERGFLLAFEIFAILVVGAVVTFCAWMWISDPHFLP